jgi:hypothetical protein
MKPPSKPRVHVFYERKGLWTVILAGLTYHQPIERRYIRLAHYSTRDSANAYAKVMRAALRGAAIGGGK